MFIAGSFDEIPAYNPLNSSCVYLPDAPINPSVITNDDKSDSAPIIISSIGVIVLAIGIIAFFIWLVANHK